MNSLSTAQILLTVSVSALISGLMCYIGVWGIEKHQNRRLTELEFDLESTRSSLKSFQKTVSGRMGAEERQAKKSIEEEAKLRLASNGGVTDDSAWINGG